MYDSVGMTMLDALQDLLDACGSVDLAVKFSSHDVLEEFSTSDKVKDKVVEILLLNDKNCTWKICMIRFTYPSDSTNTEFFFCKVISATFKQRCIVKYTSNVFHLF